MQNCPSMKEPQRFARRGIVEGFFGPLWTMAHRARLFEFGAARGMNTYLYAPKDDPYHREHWTKPYPVSQWKALQRLIHRAQKSKLDFVYGFHPGKGLCFSAEKPVHILLAKAQRFYDTGVRTFAVQFDDIPSRLVYEIDRRTFKNSLALAQGTWLQKIISRQPAAWKNVEWWICPSYYTLDPLLARVFGAFEPGFLEKLAQSLPPGIACFWTGPSVVSQKITLNHVREIASRVKRRLIIWDNYPVNDLSMRDELHIGPLQGRDPRLPEAAYGYLSNPLLQEELGFIPLASCFDYAAHPAGYKPEASWMTIVKQRFGSKAISPWRTIRAFCEKHQQAKKTKRPIRISPKERLRLQAATVYLRAHQREKWAREIKPWQDLMERSLK
jgi:hyaluronoglucosaminidase